MPTKAVINLLRVSNNKNFLVLPAQPQRPFLLEFWKNLQGNLGKNFHFLFSWFGLLISYLKMYGGNLDSREANTAINPAFPAFSIPVAHALRPSQDIGGIPTASAFAVPPSYF